MQTGWATTAQGARKPPRWAVETVEFNSTKYGPEVLIDCAWVGEMPTFLRGGRPNTLTFHELLLVTRGSGGFWLDAHRYEIRPGTVLFATPGQVRRYETGDLEGLCLFFPALFLGEFLHDPYFLDRLPYFRAPAGAAELELPANRQIALREDLLAMRQELLGLRADSIDLLRARLYGALIALARDYSTAYRAEPARPVNRLTLRYRDLVYRDAARRHTVADYARELAVTPGHLNSLCRRYLGRGAKELIQDQLLALARRALLYSEESTARIGYSLGFRDPAYFTRFFRSVTGRSPSQFRSQHRPAPGAATPLTG